MRLPATLRQGQIETSGCTMVLHTLQYEGGNVVIRLGPGSTFLLHQDVLVDRSPYFKAMLSDRWHKPATTSKDRDNKIVIWELDLFLDQSEGTADLRVGVRKTPSCFI